MDQNISVPSNVLRPATLTVPSIDIQQFAAMVTQSTSLNSNFAYNLNLRFSLDGPVENQEATMPYMTSPLPTFTDPQLATMSGGDVLHENDRALAYDLGFQHQPAQANYTLPVTTNNHSSATTPHNAVCRFLILFSFIC